MLFSYQSIISINILPFFHRFLNNLEDKMLLKKLYTKYFMNYSILKHG